MPPTVKPAAVEHRFLRVRVGGEDRLGRVGAAVGRELRGRRVDARAHALERQRRADHAGREDEHLFRREPEQPRAACSAVAIASAIPCAPVAAFATPELTTTACGWASSRFAFDTTTGAACTRFCVHIAAPVARESTRAAARRPCGRAGCPRAPRRRRSPCAAVTLIRAPRAAAARRSRRARARGSRSAPPGRRRPCRGCRARR